MAAVEVQRSARRPNSAPSAMLGFMPAMPATPHARLKSDEFFVEWLSLSGVQKAIEEEVIALSEGTWEAPDTFAFSLHSRRSPESPPVSPVPRQSPRRPSNRTVSSSRRSSLTATSPKTQLRRSVGASTIEASPVAIPPFWNITLPAVEQDNVVKDIKAVFARSGAIDIDCFGAIVEASRLPLYWAGAVFHSCTKSSEPLTAAAYLSFLKQSQIHSRDAASRFVYMLNPGATYLEPSDFQPMIRYVLSHHPGLDFLADAPEFHDRYVDTVIARIFYHVNRSWDLKITANQLRRSGFLDIVESLTDEPDINRVPSDLYFSYESFYVIYTHFWKLDSDHDLYIDSMELSRYGDSGLSERALSRIFQSTVMLPRKDADPAKADLLSYFDFVYYILSDEDKSTPTAIEYWFRVADLDGDGVLSLYELEYFYEEQEDRLIELAVEALTFNDCLCQMLDAVKPATPHYVTLRDLKRSQQAALFFNVFLNVNKFLDMEEQDQFELQREREELGGQLPSSWDQFAQREYDLLAAEEEGGNDDDWSSDSDDDAWPLY